VQGIEGWYENGELKEQIYNIAASADRMQTDGTVSPTDALVNLETGAPEAGKGSAEFMVTWNDQDFNLELHAFYYVRVIQLPTARWTLRDEILFWLKSNSHAGCLTLRVLFIYIGTRE
jgi:hypothetical protein